MALIRHVLLASLLRFLRYGDLTPSYARHNAEQEYGIQMAVGLRGSF